MAHRRPQSNEQPERTERFDAGGHSRTTATGFVSQLQRRPHHPFPADAPTLAAFARQARVGRCLEDALRDLVAEDAEIGDDAASSSSTPGIKRSGRQSANDVERGSAGRRTQRNKRKRSAEASPSSRLSKEAKKRPQGDADSECFGNDEDDDNDEAQSPHKGTRGRIRFDARTAKRVISAFGDGVAWSWGANKQSSKQSSSSSSGGRFSPSSTSTSVRPPRLTLPCSGAPDALLRGRVKYYNRMGSRWRIVVSGGAQIRPRVNFDPLRRKLHGQTLWERSESLAGVGVEVVNGEVAGSRGGNQKQQSRIPTVNVDGDLEILAFADVI